MVGLLRKDDARESWCLGDRRLLEVNDLRFRTAVDEAVCMSFELVPVRPLKRSARKM